MLVDDEEWFRAQSKRMSLPLEPDYTKFRIADPDIGQVHALFWSPSIDPSCWTAFFVFDLYDRRGLPGVKEWCTEQFGPAWPSAEGRWHAKDDLFAFMDEADGFAFRLRWC